VTVNAPSDPPAALVPPPLPSPDFDSEGFWAAAAERRLTVCRCQACGEWLQPPLERCRRCAGPTAFEDVAGTGEIYSFIVVRHPSVPAFVPRLPYAIAVVTLDEGVRLPGMVVGIDTSEVAIGQRVTAEWESLPGSDDPALVWRVTG